MGDNDIIIFALGLLVGGFFVWLIMGRYRGGYTQEIKRDAEGNIISITYLPLMESVQL